ncbi:uncharacterized protein MKZ38_008121 [Zalerion maritima]|uniref:DNA-directed RNA polymerase n=1 Tax=Zalerion maritima TaxID=339359 RepID=A0AAD5RIB9_9PEZI|nr:uncharacterized protein MKZ38_008121 [Zalerion maritima]
MLARQCRGSRSLVRLSPSTTTTAWKLGRPQCHLAPSIARIRSLVTSADSRARPLSRPSRATKLSNHSGQPDRKLATAMGEYRPSSQPGLDYPPPSISPEPLPLTFNPSEVLQVPYPEPPSLHVRTRISPMGISGNMDEVWHVFDACLRVGKLDRARLFIERLSGHLVGNATPEQMIALHDRYLRASIDELLADHDSERANTLHTWYEIYIRNRKLPATAVTIACMLKLSILSSQGSRLESHINRYMNTIDYDTRLQVLTIADILSPQDLAQITKVSPQSYDMSEGISEDELETPYMNSDGTVADIPQVDPVNQKGQGLKALKKSLSLFTQIPEGQDFTSLSLDEMREIQSKLERDSLDSAIESWRRIHIENVKRGYVDASSIFGSVLYSWHVEMEARLKLEWLAIDKAEKCGARTKSDQDRCLYGPLLQMSRPDRVAAATIIAVINTLSLQGIEKGTSISTIVHHLGKVVEEDTKTLQRNGGRNPKPARRSLPAVLRQHAIHSKTVAPEGESNALQEWPSNIRLKLAGMLVHTLLNTCKVKAVKEHPDTKEFISQQQPAFGQGFVFKKGKKVGTLMANPQLVSMMMREPRPEVLVRQLPMIVPPDPWTKFDKGGYLDSPTRFIRAKSGEVDQKIYAEAAIARGDMESLFKGLDSLGKTPWRINSKVLNVMIKAWNTGEAIANIPSLNPDLPLPPEPEENSDPAVRHQWARAVRKVENEKSGMRSNRCFINYQLEIARSFRNHTVYFPHNLDFRGRAYPIPPLLNHMGADHARGLLMFGKGKKLGETGLMWLKVHLSNVFGFDKASLKERADFAMEHWNDVLDSTDDPLGGKRWWLEAEDPWQTLATCFELRAALESPDPVEYVSFLPVHQDGTCNGLQHYAALGGDSWGARQVNLEPSDRPADVYSAVADLVREQVTEDSDAGLEIAQWLKDKITRKVVKQTVMTNVYGVTFSGARAQIMKQLDDLYPNLHSESGISIPSFGGYLAKCVFKALGTMFEGAHDIQRWLGESANRVCRSLGSDQLEDLSQLPMDDIGGSTSKKTVQVEIKTRLRSTLVWTTPLRLPVAQPYRKIESKKISTCLQDIAMPSTHRTHPVNRRKQLQGFPPNFIHSLDATHMLLSAIQCEKQGLSFAAVHDSFWTHACDVDTMGSILRDAFVRIHEEDVIGRLRAEFEARYGSSIYLGYVTDKTEAGKAVMAWRKKNNMPLLSEGLLEYKRQKLMASEDPTEVEEGKNMVTPASIAAQYGDPHEPTVQDGDIAVLGDMANSTSDSAAADDGEADVEADAMDAQGPIFSVASDLGESTVEETAKTPSAQKKKPTKAKPRQSLMWLPLDLPPVPKKGDFDVKRLMHSKYFFS